MDPAVMEQGQGKAGWAPANKPAPGMPGRKANGRYRGGQAPQDAAFVPEEVVKAYAKETHELPGRHKAGKTKNGKHFILLIILVIALVL